MLCEIRSDLNIVQCLSTSLGDCSNMFRKESLLFHKLVNLVDRRSGGGGIL